MSFLIQKSPDQCSQHFFHAQLAVLVVADVLDAVAQILAHFRRRVVTVVLLQQEADAALAALGVDTDDVGVVGAANVVGSTWTKRS